MKRKKSQSSKWYSVLGDNYFVGCCQFLVQLKYGLELHKQIYWFIWYYIKNGDVLHLYQLYYIYINWFFKIKYVMHARLYELHVSKACVKCTLKMWGNK